MININHSKTLVVMIIGILRALKLKLLPIDEAQHMIFSPSVLNMLIRSSCDQRIIDMIHLGTELENVASLIPDKYENSIIEIEKMAIQYMQSESKYDYNEQKSFVKFLSVS